MIDILLRDFIYKTSKIAFYQGKKSFLKNYTRIFEHPVLGKNIIWFDIIFGQTHFIDE